jgi:A/G-specific adenine glycosylase
VQPWAGTDRQIRGRLLAALRDSARSLTRDELRARATDAEATVDGWAQVDRCLGTLVDDGLAEELGGDRCRLPGGAE